MVIPLGGVNSPDGYKSWVQAFASGIGSNKAAVIIEPDAIAAIDCLSASDQQTRFGLIQYVVATLGRLPNVAVYIDAGHSGWVATSVMADRLKQAGISAADGFALNASNFISTSDNVRYGTEISGKISGKHFVVDTSRNGNGATPDHQWCNPSGRALGQKPSTRTGLANVDAYLWIKPPGSSDGQCSGGPSAGVFWPEYAVGLAERAGY